MIRLVESPSGGLYVGGSVQDAAAGSDGYPDGGLLLGGLVLDAAAGMEAPAGGLLLGGTVQDAAAGYDTSSGGLLIGGEVCDMCISTITVAQQITGGGSTDSVNIGHATSAHTAGSYGSSADILEVTVDAEGHVTAITALAIAITAAQVSGLAAVATSGAASDLTGLAAVATSGSASDLSTGTLSVGLLPGGGVNGAGQLVELDGSGNLPAVGGAALVGLTAVQVGAAADLTGNPSGTSTAALVSVFDKTISTGLHGSFCLKNTHATNGLSYQLFVKDVFGTTATSPVTALGHGSVVEGTMETLISTFSLSAVFYPLVEARLQVEDTVAGTHATYQAYYSFQG